MVYSAKPAVALGVPEMTQLELRIKPDGSEGESLHDVGKPPPKKEMGVTGLMV